VIAKVYYTFSVIIWHSTEPPFKNEYFNKKDKGIYVDAVSGLPLFSSNDKFESYSGWPSFRKPIFTEHIKFQMEKDGRIEVLSIDNCHLGHLFLHEIKEEPIRYCLNSKALQFISFDDLEKENVYNKNYSELKNIF
jgi:peptide methionine sulfoxide reductase msrA/msrB